MRPFVLAIEAEPLAAATMADKRAAGDCVLDMTDTNNLFPSAASPSSSPEVVPPSTEERGSNSAAVPERSTTAEQPLNLKQMEEEIEGEMKRAKEAQKSWNGDVLASPSIWRVRPFIRKTDDEAYEPRLISIGPLHHENPILQPMEEVKLIYLNSLCDRSTHNDIRKYLEVISDCDFRARAHYADQFKLNREKFVKMLVVDGCFIIEYLVRRVFKQTGEMGHLSNVKWGLAELRRDLMLLENQIPFFVLAALFDQSVIPFKGARKKALTLMDLALAFLGRLKEGDPPLAEEVLHLLHLEHLFLNPSRGAGQSQQQPVTSDKKNDVPRMIQCATKLREAGIKFKLPATEEKKPTKSLNLKVSFSEGTICMPCLKVDKATVTRLRNLIALEQHCGKVGSHCTSFAILMDNIIDTASDVAVLTKKRIIEHKMGSGDEVAQTFNTLANEAYLKYDDHYNASLFKDVTKYCKVRSHRWRASLEITHLDTPWKILSVAAAVLLLALTATQTVFSIINN